MAEDGYRLFGGQDVQDGWGEYVSTNPDGTWNIRIKFVLTETGKNLEGYEGKVVITSANPPFPGQKLASGFRQVLSEPWLDDEEPA